MQNKTLQQRLDEERAKSPITKKSQKAINATHQNADRKFDTEYQKKFKELMASEEYLDKVCKATQTPEFRKLKQKQSKESWENPETRKKRIESLNRPEIKAKQSAAAKRREANPEFAKRKKDILKDTYSDPERNKKISEKRKQFFKDNPEHRKLLSEKQLALAATRTKEFHDNIHKKRKESGWEDKVKQAGLNRRKSIVAGGIPFESRLAAIEHYKFDPAMIQYNIKKDPSNWYYITREEYERLTNLNK